ncbi:MAG: YqaA family protein [Planctomycetota bacterium]
MTSTPPPSLPAEAVPSKRPSPLKRLYNWVLHWADTPYGTPALAVMSFAESSFFPIPPDVLLIALCLGDRARSFRFAFWCSLASVVGGLAGYAIGALLWDTTGLDEFFFTYVPGFTHEVFDKVKLQYEQYNFWIVFVAAFTPIPYKVITITAGICGISLPMFLLASAIGRSARFYLVAFMLWRYGEPVKRILDKHLGWLTFALAALGIGGFVAIKYLF